MVAKDTKSIDKIVISEDEFLQFIHNSLDVIEEQISNDLQQQDALYRLYKNYFVDKREFNLTFYYDNGNLGYDKVKKPTIGFKITGGTK